VPVTEYFSQVQKEISSSTLIIGTRLTYEERSPYAGYISGTIVVEGGVEIHIREYVDVRYGIKYLKYAYHCICGKRFLFRYDNTADPQANALSSAPEHKHTSDGKIIASHKPKLSTVILEAAKSVL
jgi:hypothetical protein